MFSLNPFMTASRRTCAIFGVALSLPSVAAAEVAPSHCNLIDLRLALLSPNGEDQFWDCYEALLAKPDWSSHLMMEVASQTSDPRVVLFLSEVGADLYSEGDEGTALDVALRHNPDTTIVATLLALDASHSLGIDAAPSVRPEHERLVSLIAETNDLSRFPPPDASVDCSDFLTATFIMEASPGRIRYCQQNTSPLTRDAQENSALHLAARYSDDPSVIDAIIGGIPEEQRANFLKARNSEDETALHVAARYAHDPEIVTALLMHGADANALARNESVRFGQNRGNSPLHRAVRHNDPDIAVAIVARLLAADADINIQLPTSDDGFGGAMALHLAAHDAADDTLLWLLVHAARSSGWFFERAIREDWLDRKRDDTDRTALHYLSRSSNHPDAFTMLLRYGLSPDAQDDEGLTPLILYAGRGEDPGIMHMLLDQSDVPCYADTEGRSALGYARQNSALHPATGDGNDVSPRDRLISECG